MTDLYLPYIGKNVDTKDRRLVTISRAFTVIAGLAAVGVSMLLPTILDGCFYAYYIYTSGVFAQSSLVYSGRRLLNRARLLASWQAASL